MTTVSIAKTAEFHAGKAGILVSEGPEWSEVRIDRNGKSGVYNVLTRDIVRK